MIVEDHIWTRQGLVEIVDWASLNIEIKCVCEDAQQAIKFLNKERVDIVLTDIRMDGMTGLELTEYIKNKDRSIQVILISAYHEFEYALKALNLGASSYILKPIDESELKLKIRECIKEIDNLSKTKTKLKKYSMIQIIDIFKSSFMKTSDKKELFNRLVVLEPSYEQNNFAIFGIEILSSNIAISDLIKYLRNNWQSTIWIEDSGYIIGVSFVNTKTTIYNINTKLIRILTSHTNIKYRIAIGPIVNFKEIYKAHDSIFAYMNHCFLSSINDFNVFEYDDISMINKINSNLFNSVDIWKMMKSGKVNEIKALLFNVKDRCIKNNYSKEDIKKWISSLIGDLTVYLENEGIMINISINKIVSLKSYDEINREVIKFVKQASNEIVQIKNTTTRHIVRLSIAYIRENYHQKNISLAIIAENMKVSYTYLSKVFKQDTGMSFIRYLNTYRINQAEKLLKNSQLKIYEISEKVGIEPSHFNSVFKKITGLNPSKYRSL